MGKSAFDWALALIGAALGAGLGLAIFHWLYNQNLYGMVVPGACLGLGALLLSPSRSTPRGVVFGVAALILGLLTESHYFPFVADERLAYFLAHIPSINPAHLLMIALGGLFGFWWGRDASPWMRRSAMAAKPVKVQDAVERD